MNSKLILGSQKRLALMVSLCLLGSHAALGGPLVLQGQNRGDTNSWYAGNMEYWRELDYIPCRVWANAARWGSSHTVTVTFPHFNGTTPGFQNLTAFTPSPNDVITAGPTLYAPPTTAVWSYTFSFRVTDSSPGGFTSWRGWQPALT